VLLAFEPAMLPVGDGVRKRLGAARHPRRLSPVEDEGRSGHGAQAIRGQREAADDPRVVGERVGDGLHPAPHGRVSHLGDELRRNSDRGRHEVLDRIPSSI
jgi:hypothetical protein